MKILHTFKTNTKTLNDLQLERQAWFPIHQAFDIFIWLLSHCSLTG